MHESSAKDWCMHLMPMINVSLMHSGRSYLRFSSVWRRSLWKTHFLSCSTEISLSKARVLCHYRLELITSDVLSSMRKPNLTYGTKSTYLLLSDSFLGRGHLIMSLTLSSTCNKSSCFSWITFYVYNKWYSSYISCWGSIMASSPPLVNAWIEAHVDAKEILSHGLSLERY